MGLESCSEESGGELNSDTTESEQRKSPCRSQNLLTEPNTSDSKHMVSTESLAIHSTED